MITSIEWSYAYVFLSIRDRHGVNRGNNYIPVGCDIGSRKVSIFMFYIIQVLATGSQM